MKQLLPILLFAFVWNALNAQEIKAEALSQTPINETPIRVICPKVLNSNVKYLFVVDGAIRTDVNYNSLSEIDPKDIIDIKVSRDIPAFFCYANYDAIIFITTTKNSLRLKVTRETSYKVYTIINENFASIQDTYNIMVSQVPGLTIATANNNEPGIEMRGDANTQVFVDGIRCNPSILGNLNVNDIEKIEISNHPGIINSFR